MAVVQQTVMLRERMQLAGDNSIKTFETTDSDWEQNGRHGMGQEK